MDDEAEKNCENRLDGKGMVPEERPSVTEGGLWVLVIGIGSTLAASQIMSMFGLTF